MSHRGRLNVLANVMSQALSPALPRIPGRQREPERSAGLGRREISSRRLVGPRVRRREGASVADAQSLASRSRRSGRARQGARQAVSARRRPGAHERAAAAHPWRRGVCRPGRCRRMLRDVGHQGLPHRRHDPLHRQQPDRLHHRADLFALVALPVRRRADGAGADLPCERRRSRSGRACRAHRDRIPPAVPQGRRHRHVLLSPLRPQRERRAGVHAAPDVQGDQGSSDDARALRDASWSPKARSIRATSRT